MALLLALLAPAPAAQEAPAAPPAPAPAAPGDVRRLQVGHWVRIKGSLEASGVFRGEAVEVREPADEEGLLGMVESVSADGQEFVLLGQRVSASARTQWDGVDPSSLAGARVEVEGHWRGPGKFSAREVTLRKPGRDRVEGRVDALVPRPGGGVELQLLHLRVPLDAGVPVESARPLDDLPLAPGRPAQEARQVRDDDDRIEGVTALTETLSFGGQVEVQAERRKNLDLDDDLRTDRLDTGQSLRGELTWEPSDDVFALFGFRGSKDVSRRTNDDNEREVDGSVTELYGYWRDPLRLGFDVQAGRQDFDEPREWIHDQNLDALRLLWLGEGLRLELSASTVLADGSRRDRESNNLLAYLSNGDWNRHLAAWVLRRSDTESPDEDDPLHLGLRALGEWLPDQEVWLEAAWLRGEADDGLDRRAFGWDLGTTWSPATLEPLRLTAGLARGSGDGDTTDGVDETFRQTGLHDNNGRFGGLTSFRYYGEVLDPELANLEVGTLAVGFDPLDELSLDLVWHGLRQDEATAQQFETNLKLKPDGLHRELGHELDLVLGWRPDRDWDAELVVGTFQPGSAFPGGDRAWLVSAQVRWRF
jgi:alginate production protein